MDERITTAEDYDNSSSYRSGGIGFARSRTNSLSPSEFFEFRRLLESLIAADRIVRAESKGF